MVPASGEEHVNNTVLFVCPHGAGMSRIAAVWFNLVAPPGWHATSAGIQPQPELGLNARRLLASTAAERLLDREPPRSISAIASPTCVVAICCDVPDAEHWDLAEREFTEAMGEEIRVRSEVLARWCSKLDAEVEPTLSLV